MVAFEELRLKETFDYRDGNYNNQCVPEEWEDNQPERYKRVTSELNSLADEIVSSYTEFIRLSRKKLGVTLPDS